MELWWNSLGLALQIFYGIALASTALLVLQLLLVLVGFDGGDTDMDFEAESHDFGGAMSVRSVTAFFAGFGWGGAAAIRSGLGMLSAGLIALATGGAMMLLGVLMMRGLASMKASGTLNYSNAIGQVGNVYLPIPPNMEGPGQIEVLVQGRLAVVQAFTRADYRLPNRSRVRVVETLDQQSLVVEPLAGATPSPAAEGDPSTPNPTPKES